MLSKITSHRLNWADKAGIGLSLILLAGGIGVSAILLAAAGSGSAPMGELATYLATWIGKLQLLVALPFWIAISGVRALGHASMNVVRKASHRAERGHAPITALHA